MLPAAGRLKRFPPVPSPPHVTGARLQVVAAARSGTLSARLGIHGVPVHPAKHGPVSGFGPAPAALDRYP